ncbi:MAG: uroporphyrinogen decarboxylase family protein [Cephaloticoccus sp.]|nr:uroporphyrinogen decarboxylase family protein [Cephaloticoccus sp.]MCF7760396.1 uroporphyrinogen decarboxylase family protein [Cephaloticoccus sp.]
MNSRERILATIRHEEPDRVPISPRVWAWLLAEHGSQNLATHLRVFPDMDQMQPCDDGTFNPLDAYPDAYAIPQVRVEQSKYQEGDFTVVERTFLTPAGNLSDRIMIPPPGREFGVNPNPVRTEYLVKEPADLPALRYVLPPINTNYDFLTGLQRQMGDHGFMQITVRSALDHNAGHARDMAELMVDYYDNRPFFDELLDIFHQRSLQQIKAALEGGAEFIFGTWYFASLSAGWSPAIFSEVFVPQIREHVELTHRYGAGYNYYDDGRLAHTMGMIAATGVDVLETCTPAPTGDFDLHTAKETIGTKTTLKGYIDLLHVVKEGTPTLIDHAVKTAMEIGKPGGGFIIGSSDSFREGTPRENIAAYFAACHRHGRY